MSESFIREYLDNYIFILGFTIISAQTKYVLLILYYIYINVNLQLREEILSDYTLY